MIRNNKHLKAKPDSYQQVIVNYRNAVYQGQYDQQKEQRVGRGLLYFPNSHQFIACSHFKQGRVADLALFFNSHARYLYGEWEKNAPNGLCVFRMGEVIIITQYQQGKLQPGTNVLFIFEKYCLAVVIELQQGNNWSIRSKSQVLGFEQMQSLITQCGFDSSKLSPSLIKFLNQQFSYNNSNSFKLRLIKNKYFRFGFDDGLSLFFDEDHQIVSVGQHQRNELVGVGVKFGPQEMGGFTEEGIFDGCNTFAYESSNKPEHKIGQMYSRFHLAAVNFKNQFVCNPSETYLSFFENLMKESKFIDLINQLAPNSSFPQDNQLERRHERMDFQSRKVFLGPVKQHPLCLDELSSKRRMENESGSFQRLSQRNRLKIMKKQLFGSITPKEFPAKIIPEKLERQSSRVKKQERQPINPIKEQRQKESDSASERRSQHSKNANLQQRIDIIIHQPPPQEMLSRSKSKKKIFELTKSIKRDYSPETQVSPFKSTMKARIFDESYSPSRSKSRKRQIFKEQVNSKSATRIKQVDQYKSPHLQLGFSAIKSNSSSQIGSLPVTITKQARNHYKSRESDAIQGEDSSNMKLIQQSKTSFKENFKIKEKEHSNFKKGNTVYRNPMVRGYNDYVYQPINLKQAGNSPYMKNSSQKSLVRNKSTNNIPDQSNKKTIAESSPYKKKMSHYLNNNNDNQPKLNEKYSHYKKRTGYF